MPVRRSVSGGRRKRRSVSRKRVPTRRRKTTRRKRSGSGATTHKSAPIKIDGTFTAYDVKNKKKVTIKDPRLIKLTKGKGVRAMIQGTSPLAPHNKVTTFASKDDPKVKKYF
tara:strand:- start:10211 stop:10546 length:336 start_codon:yes stop_codon:yes gene_type:complete